MACSDAAVTREPRTHRNSRTTAYRTVREAGRFRDRKRVVLRNACIQTQWQVLFGCTRIAGHIHGCRFGLPRSAETTSRTSLNRRGAREGRKGCSRSTGVNDGLAPFRPTLWRTHSPGND